jgi:hypothetical protein
MAKGVLGYIASEQHDGLSGLSKLNTMDGFMIFTRDDIRACAYMVT